MSNAIAIINKQIICDQLAQGMRLSEIASLLGITPAAISQQLVNDPDYTTAQVLFVQKTSLMLHAHVNYYYTVDG